MDDLKQRICDYIRDYMNAPFNVKPEHFLTADLGIDGDQGMYFIEGFSKEFPAWPSPLIFRVDGFQVNCWTSFAICSPVRIRFEKGSLICVFRI